MVRPEDLCIIACKGKSTDNFLINQTRYVCTWVNEMHRTTTRNANVLNRFSQTRNAGCHVKVKKATQQNNNTDEAIKQNYDA